VAPPRTVIVAGAGIGGLSASLALARSGFYVTWLEQAAELTDIGAGIQLTPNATRILLELGLGDRLKSHVVTPEEIRIRNGAGKDLAHIPLGKLAQERYGAPYWVIHRGDLQSTLLDIVRGEPEITLTLGAEVEKFAFDGKGVVVHAVRNRTDFQSDEGITLDTHGIALIGADGLSSIIRYDLATMGRWHNAASSQPRYSNRTAWRATVPHSAVPDEFRESVVHLWLGRKAHLVHYPVKGGTAINIVAITTDDRSRPNWAAEDGTPEEVLVHFRPGEWSDKAVAILKTPELWLRWPLFDRPPGTHWGRGLVTLLGDAAHPMLPFLAQGAAMAIEDAAVLADSLRNMPDDPEQALRLYEDQRRPRTARVQRRARRNGLIYHLGGPAALARDLLLRRLDGERLLAHFDWLYDWQPATNPE
jgi:salicylate hydroxylase